MIILRNFSFEIDPDTVDSARILAPFLDILKAPYLAGPFKLVALDAIQTFLSGNLICDVAESLVSISCSDKAHGRHTLSNVVDAVAR